MTTKPSFADLKKKFKDQEAAKKNSGSERKFRNNDVYPFWQMEDGDEAIVRILPDLIGPANPNPFPISIEYLEHTISINGEDRKIPSLENWGERDPIAELSQKYYKQGDKEKGKYYWRNKINLLRALIIKDPLKPDEETGEKAEGKVKTLRFGFQLMEALNKAIASEDMDVEPWDLEKGFNFKISKTAQPGSSDGKKNFTYAIGSGFVRSPSDITDAGVELIDLRTLLPEKPSLEKVERMLQAHLTGEDYDENGGEKKEQTTTTETPTPKTETKVETKPAIVESAEPKVVEETTGDDSDDDIINKILKRKAASK